MTATRYADPVVIAVKIAESFVDLAQLVDGRIAGGELKPEWLASMPQSCIVMAPAGGAPIGQDWVPFTQSRIDVRCYAPTAWEASRIATRAKALLKTYNSGDIDGFADVFPVRRVMGPPLIRPRAPD